MKAIFVTERLDWKASPLDCFPVKRRLLAARAALHGRLPAPSAAARVGSNPKPLEGAPDRAAQLAAFDMLSEWSEGKAPEGLQAAAFMLEDQFKPEEVRRANWEALQQAPPWRAPPAVRPLPPVPLHRTLRQLSK